MVNLRTALGRNGIQDWIIQRVSALYLLLYFSFLLFVWLKAGPDEYIIWPNVFTDILVRNATVLAMIFFLAHTWIGLWIVLTDYLKNAWMRLLTLIFIFCILVFYFIWLIQILWD